MASTLVDTKVDTETYRLEASETPSPTGPLFMDVSATTIPAAAMSTTWLKLNSTAPIHVQLEGAPIVPGHDDEPFSGAKKLRHLLENTNELIVCPGVYDGLSARTAIELGFKSLYMVSHQSRVKSCCGRYTFASLDSEWRLIVVDWSWNYSLEAGSA